MNIQRDMAARLKLLAAKFPVIVLTGARQVGKTTLLREIFASHNYVSLDLYAEAARAENEPEKFLFDNPPPLLIDEVQYAPKLFRHIKHAVDKNKNKKDLFVLTGSQKFTLMKEVSDSLAGRVAIAELEGLSTQELGERFEEQLHASSWEAILCRGFFPELWRDLSIPAFDFHRSYLAAYLERDVRQVLNVGSLRDFERFVRAVAIRSGQLLNKTELARDVGIATKTADQWLSVLSASNQITLLEPYFTNAGKRLIKSPRVYFNDVGLLSFLLGLNEKALKDYSGIGAIWETFVYAELRKLREARAIESSLWFYRDDAGREVDFVVDRGAKHTWLEAKWTEQPDARDAKFVERLAAHVSTAKLLECAIVCRAKIKYPVTAKVDAVPLQRLDALKCFGAYS